MNWKHEVNIKTDIYEAKELLDGGVAEAATIQRLGAAIADKLDTLPPRVQAAFTPLQTRLRRVRSRRGCDALLSELYDLADHEKVWLGVWLVDTVPLLRYNNGMNATAIVYFVQPPAVAPSDGVHYPWVEGPPRYVGRSRRAVKIACSDDFLRAYTRGSRRAMFEHVEFEVTEAEFKANRGFVVSGPGAGAYVFRWRVLVVPSEG